MKQIIVDNQLTNYSITEDGKCYNNKTNKFLKGQISNSGYLNYNLTLPNGNKKRFYAHRLVAQFFIPNPENKKEVNHKDLNKLNNKIENLEWVTASENQQYNIKNNNKKNMQKVYKYDKNKNLIAIYNSIAEAARINNMSESTIRQEIYRDIKALTNNFFWNSKNDNEFLVETMINNGKAKKVAQYNLNMELINTFSSLNEAARFLNISKASHISECCRGKLKTYKGYIWKFIDNDIV